MRFVFHGGLSCACAILKSLFLDAGMRRGGLFDPKYRKGIFMVIIGLFIRFEVVAVQNWS